MSDLVQRAKKFVKDTRWHQAHEFPAGEAINIIRELIRLRAEERNKLCEIICQQGYWTTDELAVVLGLE